MDQANSFFHDPINFNENELLTIWKDDTGKIITSVKNILEELDTWNEEQLEIVLKSFIENNSLGFGKVMKPIRFSISGTISGPSLFAMMGLLGKETVLKRLNKALDQY